MIDDIRPSPIREKLQEQDRIAYELKAWDAQVEKQKLPVRFFDGAKFIPKRLAEELLLQKPIINLPGLGLLTYDEETGLYSDGENWARKETRNLLGEFARNQPVAETVQHLKDCCASDAIEPDKAFIAVQNGIFDLTTRELRPFDPDIVLTAKSPVPYDPTITEAPKFDSFLDRFVGGGSNNQAVYELLGYCLYRGHPIHSAFFWVGSGRNGKGTTIRTAKKLIGPEGVCAINLDELTKNRFSRVELYRKTANLCGELPKERLLDTGFFKEATGEDQIDGEIKGVQKRISFTNYAKFVFSGNELPELGDDSHAIFSRIRVWRWEVELKPNEIIQNFEESFNPELPGILYKSLMALNGLLETGQFANDLSVDERRRLYKLNSSSCESFIADRLEASGFTPSEELYAEYLAYCREGHFSPATDKKLGRILSENGFRRTQDTIKNRRVWGYSCHFNAPKNNSDATEAGGQKML